MICIAYFIMLTEKKKKKKLCLERCCHSHTLRTLFYHFSQVVGLSTNLQFLIDLASHPQFQASNVHTDFIPEHSEELFPSRELSSAALCQAAVAMLYFQQRHVQETSLLTNGTLGKSNLIITPYIQQKG